MALSIELIATITFYYPKTVAFVKLIMKKLTIEIQDNFTNLP